MAAKVMTKPIFEVDAQGFANLQADVPKWRGLMELVQNGFDAARSFVTVVMEPSGKGLAEFSVEDDGPGFSDLAHAYTLFAGSRKAKDRHARGWMNLGEKLVIVGCEQLTIETTTGRVEFDMRKLTRQEKPRTKRANGTLIRGQLKVNRDEFDVCLSMLRGVLTPEKLKLTVNGLEVERRDPLKLIVGKMQTRYADADNVPRIRTIADGQVELVSVLPGEVATLYEMGLPVVEIGETGGDKWHLNCLQKVPIGKDRDNVPPAFLTALRVLVLNEMHAQLDRDDAAMPWVVEASSDTAAGRDAVKSVIERKFGPGAVVAAVGDEEPNRRAAAEGVQPIRGSHLTPGQWENVRTHDILPKAADVFPTPRPYGGEGGQDAPEPIPEAKLTPGMKRLVAYTAWVCENILGVKVTVRVVKKMNGSCIACYGQRTFDYSLQRLGHRYFDQAIDGDHAVEVDDLIIHEAGHELENNHLSTEYYHALTRLGARFVKLALEKRDELLRMRKG